MNSVFYKQVVERIVFIRRPGFSMCGETKTLA